MSFSVRSLLLSLVLLVASNCAPPAIGESCTPGGACAAGLQCIPSGGRHITNGMLACDATDTVCSKPCTSDADCASLGTGLICVHDCYLGSCLVGSH